MEDTAQLTRFGYSDFFDSHRLELGADIAQVVRVTAEHKGAYDVVGTMGEYRASVTGRRMLLAQKRTDFPAVGDWVIVKDDADETKVIVDILPRKTKLQKKYVGREGSQLIAANIDTVCIVASADRDFSLNRFERYVVLAREGGIQPVIILNKIDLLAESSLKAHIKEIHDRFGTIDVLVTSTKIDSGLDTLLDYIEAGKTYCFVGSSGVGKSSLINRLLGGGSIATKAIGEKSGRGQHTTTAREMYFMDGGGVIIDNPGSREVGISDSTTGVEEVFADIEATASLCKFKDCTHISEPGCAVLDALRTGLIDASHYNNYQKLQKEAAFNELSTYGKRQKDKTFGKFIKTAKDELERYQ